MKHLISFLLCLWVTGLGAAAQEILSLGELRSRIDGGTVTSEGNLYVEGIITGEPESLNHEKNVNSHYSYTSTAPASRTTYMQDAEGKYGFRLRFTATRHALIPRYSHILLNLKGLTLSKEEGFGYTISEIAPENLVRTEAGKPEDVPVKLRRIADLTPEDVYTFVTLQDCEFVFKGGSYMNVYETYLPASETNKGLGANSTLDSWASLLTDRDGKPFYMLMNGRCPWRRKGNGLPQGAGNISGILVHTVLERYGDCLGPYQIRPVAEEDIDFHGASHFKTLAEWDWMDNAPEFRTESGPRRSVVNERIAADRGSGWIRTDVEGAVVRGVDMDNPVVEDPASYGAKGGKGMVSRGAMVIRAEANKWWNWLDDRGKSVIVECSTEGISGEDLFLAFSFSAGVISPASSYHYPSWWCVEYSTDGFHFERVPMKDIALHTYPWWWNTPVYGVTNMISTQTGLGMTEHLVPLPSTLFGQNEVTLRISPSCRKAGTLGYEHNDQAAIRPNLKTVTFVNFGDVAIRYR